MARQERAVSRPIKEEPCLGGELEAKEMNDKKKWASRVIDGMTRTHSVETNQRTAVSQMSQKGTGSRENIKWN